MCFAEFNFANDTQIREIKFRENFFRENFFPRKFLPLRYLLAEVGGAPTQLIFWQFIDIAFNLAHFMLLYGEKQKI